MLPSRVVARLALAVGVLLLVVLLLRNATTLSGQYRAWTSSAQGDGATVSDAGARVGKESLETIDGMKLAWSSLTSGKTAMADEQEAEDTPVTPGDKVVVIGRLQKEDTDWVQEHLPDWQNAIYIVDNTSAQPYHTLRNKGREANPYLLYIIQHYHALPATIAFLHAHRDGYPAAWHTDAEGYDNVRSLQMLNTDFVQRNGYANLRCNWNPGCPDEIMPYKPAAPAEEGAEPDVNHVFFEAWPKLFGAGQRAPDVIATPCCAQFAVSRKQVLQRPLEDYQRLHRWLMETEEQDSVSGRVFEYLWHIIFGKDPVYCPALVECYNDVYGGS